MGVHIDELSSWGLNPGAEGDVAEAEPRLGEAHVAERLPHRGVVLDPRRLRLRRRRHHRSQNPTPRRREKLPPAQRDRPQTRIGRRRRRRRGCGI